MGIFLLWAMWAHEYLANFFKIDGHHMWGRFKSWRYVIFTKFGQHVNEMMAVAVEKFINFWWSRFLIIRQNVNMATHAILYSGLTPLVDKLDGH